MNRSGPPETTSAMRRPSPLLCACLILGSPIPATAGAPTQTGRLPNYDAPPQPTKPPPPEPRHRASEAMIATGSAVLCVGVALGVLGFGTWYENSFYERFEPSLVPGAEIGVGLGFITIGAAFLSVGVKQRERWQAGLARGSARLHLRPLIGFAQIGLVGQF